MTTLPQPQVMTVVNDDKEAGHDVDRPPEGADTCYDVCFLVGLTDLLTEGLCPYSPPSLH